MAFACQYENDVEERLHLRAIQMLAQELELPEKEIRGLYEEILCDIAQQARIRDYLVILASRGVKDSIRNHRRIIES